MARSARHFTLVAGDGAENSPRFVVVSHNRRQSPHPTPAWVWGNTPNWGRQIFQALLKFECVQPEETMDA